MNKGSNDRPPPPRMLFYKWLIYIYISSLAPSPFFFITMWELERQRKKGAMLNNGISNILAKFMTWD